MTKDRTTVPAGRPETGPKESDSAKTAAAGSPAGEGVSLAEATGGDGAEVRPAGETEVWAGRTHWKHFAGRLTLWALACALGAVLIGMAASRTEWLSGRVAFWIIVALVLVSGSVVVGHVMLTVLDHRYRLTTQRLFIERGILSRTIDQTELIRVDDVRLYRSVVDRVFGLGTVAILSTDATDRETRIEGIADPEPVAEAIRSNMRSMRRKSLFVENL
jgi:membrane protein YdbS with pleckstrin-like domain